MEDALRGILVLQRRDAATEHHRHLSHSLGSLKARQSRFEHLVRVFIVLFLISLSLLLVACNVTLVQILALHGLTRLYRALVVRYRVVI